jgi:hypothetical protein
MISANLNYAGIQRCRLDENCSLEKISSDLYFITVCPDKREKVRFISGEQLQNFGRNGSRVVPQWMKIQEWLPLAEPGEFADDDTNRSIASPLNLEILIAVNDVATEGGDYLNEKWGHNGDSD